MRLGGAGGRVIGKSDVDPSVSHFFDDFLLGRTLERGTWGFGLTDRLATVVGCSGCSFSAAATGSNQTGFPSRVVAMRRSSPVYNSRSNPNDYLLEIHARLT